MGRRCLSVQVDRGSVAFWEARMGRVRGPLRSEFGPAKILVQTGGGLRGQKARERTIAARDVVALIKEIGQAKERFKLASLAGVVSCYEAGRDRFWLHRFLVQAGVENVVVDSASIEVNRRAKRVKTDALDVRKLSAMLVRYDEGGSIKMLQTGQ